MTTNSPIVSDWRKLRRVLNRVADFWELSGHGALSNHQTCNACNILAEVNDALSPEAELKRALLSIDGSHACALLGENIQEGEAEFVEITYPDGKGASDAYKHERAAAFRALYKLRERLGIEITYALGQGL